MVQKRDNIELKIVVILIKNNMHIRGIAKTLRESHSTIFRKLEKLEKLNVVDSRVEGRNKVFFLKDTVLSRNYKIQSEINNLNEFIGKYPEFQILIKKILKKTQGLNVFLFGSYAKPIAKKESDIDIYIETGDKKIKKAIEKINSKINVKIGPFNKESDLIKEIIKNHIIIRGVEAFYDRN